MRYFEKVTRAWKKQTLRNERLPSEGPSKSNDDKGSLRILKERNKLLLEEDIRENRHTLRAYPPFVGLGTDTRCNLRCIMCTQRRADTELLANLPAIEEKYLIKFADQVFPTAELLQLNTAGEPLMSRNFDLEMALSEKYNVKVDVVTNGVLLNSKKGRLQKLSQNAKAIQFSFDSPFKKTYESIRLGADFDQVVENMRLFQKYRNGMPSADRPFFGINMVVMKRNLAELPHMVTFAKEVGADHLGLATVYIHTKEMEEESLEPCRQEFNHLVLTAQKLASSLGILISIPPLFNDVSEIESKEDHKQDCPEPELTKELRRCSFLWKRVYIDEKACILVCCEPSHPTAGNLRDDDFKEIWNGEIYLRMRRTFTGGPAYRPCHECAQSGYLAALGTF